MKHSSLFTPLVVLALIWSLFAVIREPVSPVRWAVIFVAMYILTDLISGLLHLVLDNERSLEIPVIKGLAKGFQNHHRKPTKIYRMTLYNHLYTMHLPLAIIFVMVVLCGTPTHYAVFIALAFMLHLMQMSHRWAHMPRHKVSKGLKAAQRAGILLNPAIHKRHHNGSFDSDFCIMNGWFNPVLNFFVPRIGRTNHAWIGIFLASVFMPLGFAYI